MTIKQFLKRVEKLDVDWWFTPGGMIRTGPFNDRSCPIEAVGNLPGFFCAAARKMKLSTKNRDKIVQAADNKNNTPYRKALLKVCKLQEMP